MSYFLCPKCSGKGKIAIIDPKTGKHSCPDCGTIDRTWPIKENEEDEIINIGWHDYRVYINVCMTQVYI